MDRGKDNWWDDLELLETENKECEKGKWVTPRKKRNKTREGTRGKKR